MILSDSDKKALYQLSAHPGYGVLIGLMQFTAQETYAVPPRNSDEKIAFETFCISRHAIEESMRKIGTAVSEGEHLTKLESAGEDSNGESKGYSPGRRSRA